MKLHKILRDKGISIKEISELTGIKYGTMFKYSSGERNISVKAAKKIGKVLDVPWWKFFEDETD